MVNKEIMQGQWLQIKGKIKERWGKLTDDDLEKINGKREQLIGKLQTRYGIAKQKAEEEISHFEKSLSQFGSSTEKTHHSHSDTDKTTQSSSDTDNRSKFHGKSNDQNFNRKTDRRF